MKTISRTQFRLSTVAVLLILVAGNNPAGAQQFYDNGRQWSTVPAGSAVPEDYYRHAVRVEGPITRSTPPFGYYAAPRPKEVYRLTRNELNSMYGYGGIASPGINRSRTRQRPQPDGYEQTTSGHLYIPGSNAGARAQTAGAPHRYETTDLNGSLFLPDEPLRETRQTVSAKLYRPVRQQD